MTTWWSMVRPGWLRVPGQSYFGQTWQGYPCWLTGVALRSVSDVVRLIQQAQSVRRGDPEAAVFLSRAVKGTKLLDESIALLNKSDMPVLKTVIDQ